MFELLLEYGVVLGMFIIRLAAPVALMLMVCRWVKRRCDCAAC